MTNPIEYIFGGESAERLDKVLHLALQGAEPYGGLSRSHLQRWISSGHITVDGTLREKPGWLVQPGSKLVITPPAPVKTEILSSGREIEILYQDPELMVINKPAGLSMHPGAGRSEDTLAHAVVGYLSAEEREGGARPGIVHRLDMDTTGIVVVAKTVSAHFALGRQFAGKTTGREYLALVVTTARSKREVSRAESGSIETQIGRNPKKRQEMAVIAKGGKKAVTHWRVIERFTNASLLAVTLETGRTHQIRVHMSHLGSPVIGDQLYGDFSGMPTKLKLAAQKFGRQALHARMLSFDHPVSGKRLQFEAAPPRDFLELVERFR